MRVTLSDLPASKESQQQKDHQQHQYHPRPHARPENIPDNLTASEDLGRSNDKKEKHRIA